MKVYFKLTCVLVVLVVAGCEDMTAQNAVSLDFVTNWAMSTRQPHTLTEARVYGYLGMNFRLWESKNHKYRIDLNSSFRGYFDGVFALSSRYSDAVRRNEEYELDIRQGVISITAPNWIIHVGRQQVVWGEAIGVFIADVVNPKDYRQFLIPDLNDVRIPLWGVDAQRRLGSAGTLEIFVSADPSVSKLPVPGAEFQFYRPPISIPSITTSMSRPITVGNSNSGIRYSWLRRGWDSAIFYHRALNDLPSVSTQLLRPAPHPLLGIFQDYPRINQVGATTTKPLGDFVLTGEALFTTGGRFESNTIGPAVPRDSLSVLAGFSYPLCCQYTVDVQYFQTSLFGTSNQLITPGFRSGVSVLVADVASLRRFKPSVQAVVSPNQHDYWIYPSVTTRLTNSCFLTLGLNWFNGRIDTQFGQFRNASRVEVGLLWKVR